MCTSRLPKNLTCGEDGTYKTGFCASHAKDVMLDIVSKMYGHPDCKTKASFMVIGSKPRLCSKHALDGMSNVRNKKCSAEGCLTKATYGVDGSKKAEFCAPHA